jgi:hypothetical protein
MTLAPRTPSDPAQGSPYTLVLDTTEALFERAAAERRRWRADLEWLTACSQ